MIRKAPADLLAWITGSLASGQTVCVSTALRTTKVTPKLAQRFAAAGYPVFRASEKSLYMVAGRRYDCIDYCCISFRYACIDYCRITVQS
jgi:hypothetical protein